MCNFTDCFVNRTRNGVRCVPSVGDVISNTAIVHVMCHIARHLLQFRANSAYVMGKIFLVLDYR